MGIIKGIIKHLKFGIPTLDNLFLGNERRDVAAGGIVLPSGDEHTETTSICIVGPDGSGKSLFALHLASRYAADVWTNRSEDDARQAHSIFVSTDFTHSRAKGVWDNFGLDHPYGRKLPFESFLEPNQRRSEEDLAQRELTVELKACSPLGSDENSIAAVLTAPEHSSPRVKFLDVAKQSSGDDWAFMCRLLSLLPEIQDRKAAHLLIIDAVEGFETLVGKEDQFGQEQSRRARIAQIIRLATGKCHLVFVAEEPEARPSIPEQFVADVVIRLRAEQTQGTTRHTLEIEKARGQRHALGRQPYFIRDGSGSSTGSERNLDDPRIFHGKTFEPPPFGTGPGTWTFDPGYKGILTKGFDTNSIRANFQGYIHVTHSIHQRSREILELDRETGFTPENRVVRFGIANLDSLLMADVALSSAVPKRGLPYNRLSALIGEAGTNKSDLGQLWMSQAFHDYVDSLLKLTRWFVSPTISPVPGDLWLPSNLRAVMNQWHEVMESRELNGTHLETLDLFDPRDRGNSNEASSAEIDAAYVWLYRDRDIIKYLNDKVNANETRLGRALKMATLFLRSRYGLTCEPIPVDLQDEGVAVLLSTRDDTSDTVAERIVDRLMRSFKSSIDLLISEFGAGDVATHRASITRLLKDQVRRRLIVRRLEIHNATPEGVFHIIESLVHAGRRVLLGDYPYQKRYDRDPEKDAEVAKARREDDRRYYKASGRIRFVLDDFSSFRDSYPDLKHDSVFLPFLVFWLGRMGVTGLIVCTADGRPTSEITDPIEVQLRALVAQRVQTWRVGFHGTQRVAITAIPSYQWDRPSPVRELVRPDEGLELRVSREFELYSSLAHSRPERVPLEIRLFSHTAAAAKFISEENKVFRSVFGSQTTSEALNKEPGAILFGAQIEDYDVLRDFCHLQGGARLDRTLILQIDEFWLTGKDSKSSAQSALRKLDGYLNDLLNGSESAEDFYGMFRKHGGGTSRISQFAAIDESGNETTFGKTGYCREDRVPFTWDFGFLLCSRRAWTEALTENLPTFSTYEFLGNGEVVQTKADNAFKSVGAVWKRLPGGGLRPKSRRTLVAERSDPVSWSEFLMAASAVARVRSLRTGIPTAAFDFSRMSKGTVVCLLLELWASEICRWMRTPEQKKAFRSELSTPAKPSQQGLTRWLKEYRAELFMAILLLTEVLNVEDIRDPQDPFETRVGDPIKEAISARHWYSTACNIVGDNDLTPVGLPGYFSVRGDWYLAVAEGSRSDLLAERALDLLSSRRSNIMRMQLGMGLATRALGTPERNRTRLSWFVPKQNPEEPEGCDPRPTDFVRRFMNHAEVAGLGASGSDGDFSWLWRSSLSDFDRQSRVFRKSLTGLLQRWYEHREFLDSDWVRGFELYDFITQYREWQEHKDPSRTSKTFWQALSEPVWNSRLEPGGTLKTWRDLDDSCNEMIKLLQIATHGELAVEPSDG